MDYSIPQGAYAGRMPDAVDDARYQFDPVLLAQAAAAAASVYESEPDYFEGTPLDDMRKLASLSEKERLYMAYKRRQELEDRIKNRCRPKPVAAMDASATYEEEMRKYREQNPSS